MHSDWVRMIEETNVFQSSSASGIIQPAWTSSGPNLDEVLLHLLDGEGTARDPSTSLFEGVDGSTHHDDAGLLEAEALEVRALLDAQALGVVVLDAHQTFISRELGEDLELLITLQVEDELGALAVILRELDVLDLVHDRRLHGFDGLVVHVCLLC